MDAIVLFLQKNPIIPLFLTLGLGFWLGKKKIGSFSLGTVAATLIVGVIVGQLKIVIPDMVKNVFFLLFLFATGYSVGPQFFRAFKGPGLRMALFAVVEAAVCAGVVIAAAYIMGYGTGVAAGLYAGSQTVSACLGLLSDTVKEMPLGDADRAHLLMIIPACYAVTYVLGTVGTAWFLSGAAPSMLGGLAKVKAETAAIEQSMSSGAPTYGPGMIPAARPVAFRAFKAQGDYFDTPHTIAEIEEHFSDGDQRVVVERARVGGKIVAASPTLVVSAGDTLVVGSRRRGLVGLADKLGPEISDPELLTFGAERTPVTVSGKGVDGMTLAQICEKPFMEGVIVASIKRTGLSLPVKPQTELHAGDVITIVGWPREVTAAAAAIGYADRDTDITDMVFLGLGIAAGCVLGALSIRINGIPMALGLSVGALISGLVLGWLRARKPSFGHIPSGALWILSNLGINMFIAVLGITAGGALMHGLREAGVAIILVGGVLSLLSLAICVLIGRKIFKFSTPTTLGCVAGGRCSVAAIGAVRQVLDSDVPNLGFTVTYAVANISLVFASLAVLFLV